MGGLLWRLFPRVRTAERTRFLFFVALYGLVSVAQTVGLVGAESIFLAREGAGALPLTFVAASLATVGASLVYAWVVGRARNDALFAVLLAGTGVALGGASLLVASPWAPVAFFCTWFAAQAIFQNHYWTFVGDFFDTPASNRLGPLFVVGGSLGGALGGALAVLATRMLPAATLILAWGALLVVAGAMLRSARPMLRRWGPLGYEEADETSVAGIRAALRYARTSSMSRWLVVSALGMVLALFVAQYLYSEAFVRAWPEPEELAAFFGAFLLISNAIEVVVEMWVTPALIRRYGLPTANLVHPLLTLLSFGWLLVDFGLAAAVAARGNREMLENSLAVPVRQLVYNALPLRLRGRMRAFLEGIVIYAGMAVAGGALLLVGARAGEDGLRILSILGVAMALLYLLANLAVRRAYVRTLVTELRAGRLDLRDVGDVLGGVEVARLAELWADLLARPDVARAADAARELAPLLAERGMVEPLLRAAGHASADVRRTVVAALASLDEDRARACVLAACDDADARVRCAAVAGLCACADTDLAARERLRGCLDDPAAEVRAEAALGLGSEGHAIFEPMARSPERAEAVAALGRLPSALQWLARERVGDPDPVVCAAALDALARVGAAESVPTAEIAALLGHEDTGVRLAALPLLAAQGSDEAAAALAGALDDRTRGVRQLAAELLGGLGDAAVGPARGQLGSGRLWTLDAALAALGRAGTPRARAALVETLRARALAVWQHLLAVDALTPATTLPERFAFAAHGSALSDDLRLAFRVLEELEGPIVVRSVQRTLRLGGGRARGDALEALSNLGDRGAASLLALAHETGPLEDRIRGDARFAGRPRSADEVLARARTSNDPWLRRAGAAAAGEEEDLDAMERLLALREVPIFAHLRLDQLESISRAMQEETYVEGEILGREGEPGPKLFLLLEGEVEVWRRYGEPDQRLLNTVSAPFYLGEMAVLAAERRTATMVISKDARLASLDGEQLKELILQMPEISFEIFRELIEAVRRAERRADPPEPENA